ncbi:MAG: DUF4350 domain-containing protein [Thermoplasmatota archaeon]
MSSLIRRTALVVFLSVVALLAGSEVLSFFMVRESSDLSVLDEGERGASSLKGSLEGDFDTEVLLTTPALLFEEEEPSRTLLVSLGPQRSYSLTEDHSLRKFLQRGGRILMADDGSFLNSFSKDLGVNFIRGQLYDENFIDNPNFLKIDNVDLPFFSGFLLLNKPTALVFSEGQGLVRTSPSSWVDTNGNGIMDNISGAQSEIPGARYVASITDPGFRETGKGTAVFISDPSMFMNWMVVKEDNLEFFRSLVSYLLPRGGKVIFDESIHDTKGAHLPYQRGMRLPALLTTDINMKIVVGTLAGLTLFGVAYVHEPPRPKKHFSLLDRTGVAEIVDPSLEKSDLPEMRKVLLDRVRVAHGMSRDAFSKMDWDRLKELIGNEKLFQFARTGKMPKDADLISLLLEVNAWERR